MKDKVFKTVRARHNVLLEKKLLDEIEVAADRSMRSISAQIAFYCAEGLRREGIRVVLPPPVKVL